MLFGACVVTVVDRGMFSDLVDDAIHVARIDVHRNGRLTRRLRNVRTDVAISHFAPRLRHFFRAETYVHTKRVYASAVPYRWPVVNFDEYVVVPIGA